MKNIILILLAFISTKDIVAQYQKISTKRYPKTTDKITLTDSTYVIGYIYEQIPGKEIRVIQLLERDTISIPQEKIVKYTKLFRHRQYLLADEFHRKNPEFMTKQRKMASRFHNSMSLLVNSQINHNWKVNNSNYNRLYDEIGIDIYTGWELKNKNLIGLNLGIFYDNFLKPEINIQQQLNGSKIVERIYKGFSMSTIDYKIHLNTRYPKYLTIGLGNFLTNTNIEYLHDGTDNSSNNTNKPILSDYKIRGKFGAKIGLDFNFLLFPKNEYKYWTKKPHFYFSPEIRYTKLGVTEYEDVLNNPEPSVNYYKAHQFMYSIKLGIKF